MRTRSMRIKTSEEDRLTSLPEVLLLYILSFLDTKQAVQTSVLSKRWLNLWTLLPDFNFVGSHSGSFDSIIQQLLSVRDHSAKINSFLFSFVGTPNRSLIQRILRFVIVHGVQRLSISFSFYSYSMSRLGRFDSLRKLELNSVQFDESLSLQQLVSLHLGRVQFSCFETFSCCPNLETLSLSWCRVFYNNSHGLTVNARKLSKLTISDCSFNDRAQLVLSTPNLTSFRYTENILASVKTCDLPLLDTIDVDVFYTKYWDDMNKEKLITMLNCFPTAQVVRLSSNTCKVLYRILKTLEREPSPFRRVQTLNVTGSKSFRSAIRKLASYLLQNSPEAKLVIDLPLPRVKRSA